MDLWQVIIGVAGLVVTFVAGVFTYRAFVQDGEVRADANRWRNQDEARRLADEAKAAEATERRRVGVRHEHLIKEALQILEHVQDAACLVFTREKFLTEEDLNKYELEDRARRLGNIGARLPKEVGSLLDGDNSVSALTWTLVNSPFDARTEPQMLGSKRLEAWIIAEQASTQAVAQYVAAQELCERIDRAREGLSDLLPF